MNQFPLSSSFKEKLLHWAMTYSSAVCIEDAIEGKSLLGFGVEKTINQLEEIPSNEWVFGYISYDYKNKIEKLVSKNNETIPFDLFHFFIPQIVIEIENDKWCIRKTNISQETIISHIENSDYQTINNNKSSYSNIQNKVSKEEYINKVTNLQEHIRKGDIYEINFCQEFLQEKAEINPVDTYQKLLKKSPMPFCSLLKQNDRFVICASPERYILKQGNKLISQPIKGTAPRGNTPAEDDLLIQELQNNKKERAENIMAVDVVRNDFARVGIPTTVSVDELCKVYTFKQLHQMISTVSTKISEETHFSEIIRATFPMASMTGAPKISAMQLIEQYENTQRGLYSGTIGYLYPNGDFDFNVVIRSILYNTSKRTISFSVGSAITALADAEKEYAECLLKAEAIMQTIL